MIYKIQNFLFCSYFGNRRIQQSYHKYPSAGFELWLTWVGKGSEAWAGPHTWMIWSKLFSSFLILKKMHFRSRVSSCPITSLSPSYVFSLVSWYSKILSKCSGENQRKYIEDKLNMSYLLALNADSLLFNVFNSLSFSRSVKKGTESLFKASMVKTRFDLKAQGVQVHSSQLCTEGVCSQVLFFVRGCRAYNWTYQVLTFQELLSPSWSLSKTQPVTIPLKRPQNAFRDRLYALEFGKAQLMVFISYSLYLCIKRRHKHIQL